MSVERRTALVTGASQGIGAAIAAALAKDGFDVAVSSTRPEKLAPVLSEIQAAGGRAAAVPLDLREQDSIEKAMAHAVAALGRLDVLVNNAGIPLKRPALDITAAEWDEILGVNLTGAFFLSQQMGRHLAGRGAPGSIINIASTHGLVAMADRAAYGIAKAGLMHMTRMLAIEWAAHGIRVNAIAPGRVNTPSREATLNDSALLARALARVPLRRFAEAGEVAAAVCYLASPAAAHITGQTLVLDGGLTVA